ncbi:hypothetical protein [Bifidobacterium simiarum]|uniref:Uncharacterized protein n=1 Tax=Bifidobacterium simiarum TaxID=2045441 RepID=A0A2M9HHK5_9BIFI|nr:hypothetical protein [Bifidobacterium simiarum]MBT1166837.1 hypothetical protein [Bifidobacterium simiarum]PJM76312.1 hypothetical protein CSQ87_02055 [Bifidobacterium simiarum]
MGWINTHRSLVIGWIVVTVLYAALIVWQIVAGGKAVPLGLNFIWPAALLITNLVVGLRASDGRYGDVAYPIVSVLISVPFVMLCNHLYRETCANGDYANCTYTPDGPWRLSMTSADFYADAAWLSYFVLACAIGFVIGRQVRRSRVSSAARRSRKTA